jgi:hypothetical protein
MTGLSCIILFDIYFIEILQFCYKFRFTIQNPQSKMVLTSSNTQYRS